MEERERPRKLQKLDHGVDGAEQDTGFSITDAQQTTPSDALPFSHPSPGDSETPGDDHGNDSDAEAGQHEPAANGSGNHEAGAQPTLSKSALKKLKRKQQWEEGRSARQAKRKEKAAEKKKRKREEREQQAASGTPEDQSAAASASGPKTPHHQRAIQLPITFVFDCDFDELMTDAERVSLSSQLTRCYSENKNARFRAHLVITSFGGHLKERFDTTLLRHYEHWRGVRFMEEDFVAAAEQSKGWMRGPRGGKLAGALAKVEGTEDSREDEDEVIYLSSDSPNTLTELKPYSTYIIGGIVDKNRHKGLCYKRAVERGMQTAKLPIGDYLRMSSRFVLTTNHVLEIMLKWLELRDWGEAFVSIVPKRKGGILKGTTEEGQDGKGGEGYDSAEATPEVGETGEDLGVREDDKGNDKENDKENGSQNSAPGGVSLAGETEGEGIASSSLSEGPAAEQGA
ncbi:MAG: hypothetical protein M1819_000565 [Sarea resinae]|nr:MAG: hypothetical protein M1819_000565 [Sarea resinae]